MKKFIKHIGKVVPINRSNIDTDAIIPKQFLKKVTKNGFGEQLFYNWKYLSTNNLKLNKNFSLNKTIYQNSSILLTGKNFGCGSSREHAVWALKNYGFKVIIASSFADIFYNNSFNNQLLLINLDEKNINLVFNIVAQNPGIKMTVNLLKNYIKILEQKIFFNINSFYKHCMLNGLDSIDHTLQYKTKIKFYEKKISYFFPKVI
ncbi:3-isopropylmalate dehydratase small subunit [Buchnera aphidicola]|nr:3-isopropylmalate dehydratase small subunit [Buchnera aphidicola]